MADAGDTPARLFDEVWMDLSDEERDALVRADKLLRLVALRTAAAVAQTLRGEDLQQRVCARKSEKNVLEQAARELQVYFL